MSTLAYASLTTKREQATPGTSTTIQGPGISTYIDAFAGLVPAEVLTLHALIITQTFVSDPNPNIKGVQLPSANVSILQWAFYGLSALSIILYVVGRLQNGKWDNWDYARMLIPPLAFTGWTMIQKSTAFDSLIYNISVTPKTIDTTRTIIALFLAVLLGLAASALAYKADTKSGTSS